MSSAKLIALYLGVLLAILVILPLALTVLWLAAIVLWAFGGPRVLRWVRRNAQPLKTARRKVRFWRGMSEV